MTAIDDTTTALDSALASGALREVEVSFTDQGGHALGKRVPAGRVHASSRIAFCDAALAWNAIADVIPGTSLTGPDSGYPDAFLAPDPSTFRWLPWRAGAGHVTADVLDHHGHLHPTAPRSVLRRAIERIAALGYHAEVGVEIEFYLLGADRRPLSSDIHCYSLHKANELEPVTSAILGGLAGFVDLEGGNSEYGPGQFEVNIHHAGALAAADDGVRLKYAVRELARREGVRATFMAKPFNKVSGSSMHLHVSLWRDGEPAFAPRDGAENDLHRASLGGILQHLPALALLGAPNVNSYRRFEVDSFAPANISWGGDNRTVAVRSLIESPAATRIELRTPSSDANPYWAIAGLLAAVAAGIEDDADPGVRGEGYLYGEGAPLPTTLEAAIAATRADARLAATLGEAAVGDYAAIAESEWRAFTTEVSSWDLDRYLDTV
jgi:glutamine synthetase